MRGISFIRKTRQIIGHNFVVQAQKKKRETTNLCVFCRRIISGACWILADAIWAVIASVCARRLPNTLKYVTLMV